MGMDSRKYNADSTAEAVHLVMSPGESVAHVSVHLGISEATLGNWVLRWKQDHAGDVEEEPVTPPAELAARTAEALDIAYRSAASGQLEWRAGMKESKVDVPGCHIEAADCAEPSGPTGIYIARALSSGRLMGYPLE